MATAFAVCVGLFGMWPRVWSAATAPALAQRAGEATREEAAFAVMPLSDPETTSAQIEARWQVVQSEAGAESTAALNTARRALRARTWPITVRAGRVDGETVWVVVASWNFNAPQNPCIDTGCEAMMAAARRAAAERVLEIAIISQAAPQKILYLKKGA